MIDVSLNTKYKLLLLLLFSISILVTFLRSFNGFVFPILHAEDGPLMMAYYINNPSMSGIFRFYAGYISFIPNLIGYVSTLFRPTLLPYIMAIYCLFTSSLVLCLFALKRFRFVIRDDKVRMLVCFFLILMPIGNFAKKTSTIYSQWNLLWIAILLAWAPFGKTPIGNVLQVIGMSFIIWSHPLSFILVPIYIYNIIIRNNKQERIYNTILIAVAVTYLLIGVTPNNTLLLDISKIIITVKYIIYRVIFESLVGTQFRLDYLNPHLNITLLAGFIIINGLSYLLFSQRKRFTKSDFINLSIIGFTIVFITLFSVISRNITNENHLSPWGYRYFYIQQYMFLLGIILIFYRSWGHLNYKSNLRYSLLFLLSIYLCIINYQNIVYFDTPKQEGQNLASFLSKLELVLNDKNIRQLHSADFSSKTNFGFLGEPTQHVKELTCKYGHFPTQSLSSFFFEIKPISKHIFMFPWLAKIAENEVLTYLSQPDTAVIFHKKSPIWEESETWGHKNKDYITHIITYLDNHAIEIEPNFYISPEIAQNCYTLKLSTELLSQYHLPQIKPVAYPIGKPLKIIGFSQQQIGSNLEIQLIWSQLHFNQPFEQNYTAYLYLLNASGQRLAGIDMALTPLANSSSFETIMQSRHVIPWSTDIDPQSVSINVGAYTLQTNDIVDIGSVTLKMSDFQP